MLNLLRSIALLAVLVVLSGCVKNQQSQYASAWTFSGSPGTHWVPSPSPNPLGPPDGNCTGGTHINGWAEFTFAGLVIPGGNVVLGIELNINYRSHTDPNTVELRKGGVAVGSKLLPTGGTQSSCGNSALVTVGDSTDLWGTSLTTADFNAGSVSVRIVQNANTVDIESVQLVVYHGSAAPSPAVVMWM